MENPETLRRELAAVSGVDDVMLRIGFSGLLGNGRTDWSIVGEGVEPAREKRLASYITVVAGHRLAESDAFGMMIGQGVVAMIWRVATKPSITGICRSIKMTS